MRKVVFLLVMAVSSSGCDRGQTPSQGGTPVSAAAARSQAFDAAEVARGAALFGEHCVICHGPRAQGHPDWRTPSDGSFAAAPPLDGTGNDHRRRKQELLRVIKQGVRTEGVDVMPAYGERLNDREIEAIVTWFQSLWPPEVFEAWYRANAAESL